MLYLDGLVSQDLVNSSNLDRLLKFNNIGVRLDILPDSTPAPTEVGGPMQPLSLLKHCAGPEM